ncbi:MAG: histidine phosphatase family protein [Gallionellaceae bacterium]
MKLFIVFIIALLSFSQVVFAAEKSFVETTVTHDTIMQLRHGGYVLYMRHGTSDTSRPDRVPNVDLNDCSSQRPLTAEGVELAAKVGRAIRRAQIPVGEVFSSPMCRAKDTARAAFGANFIVLNHLRYTSNMTSGEKASMTPLTRALLSKPVAGKVNRVLVAHAPNLMDIMDYFPRLEGTVVVFKPLGDGLLKYLGSIPPAQWAKLLK